MQTQPRCYTPQDVADIIGGDTSEKTVREWIKTGELEAFNGSKSPDSAKPRYKITPEALRAFQERRRIGRPQKTSRRAKPVARKKATKSYY